MNSRLCLPAAIALLMLLASCSKHPAAAPAPADTSSPTAPTSPAASAPAAVAPAATSVAPAAAPVAAPEESEEAATRRKAMEFALLEDGFRNDARGQWATGARASSTYASKADDPKYDYHPMKATGVPDTEQYGDRGTSWATKERDLGIEWLELDFARPVNATEVRIRQNLGPGAIVKVELFDDKGAAHTVWQGPDTTVYAPNHIAWLIPKFDKTSYKAQRVKITLATNMVQGWNEIDAVQLVGD